MGGAGEVGWGIGSRSDVGGLSPPGELGVDSSFHISWRALLGVLTLICSTSIEST